MPYDIEHLKTLPFADHKCMKTPRVTDNVVFKLSKSGKTVSLITAHSAQDVPEGLLQLAWQEMNFVISEGRTYPHCLVFSYDEFLAYLFEGFAAILVEGEYDEMSADEPREFWDRKYLGHFYVKPNYIGRCSHVCNAGFVVNHLRRGMGLGTELGKQYLTIAPKLGYIYSVFNLVFATNVASWKIWDSLGFERIGYIKNVAMLKGEDKLVGRIFMTGLKALRHFAQPTRVFTLMVSDPDSSMKIKGQTECPSYVAFKSSLDREGNNGVIFDKSLRLDEQVLPTGLTKV